MLSLFDYQAENGMVPDFIGYNKVRNNWRASKPPIASWGAMNVYKVTGDKALSLIHIYRMGSLSIASELIVDHVPRKSWRK